VLLIDDYGHRHDAREAVDEFFAARGDAPLLCRMDYTGRIGVRISRSSASGRRPATGVAKDSGRGNAPRWALGGTPRLPSDL
jgi:hypothetical protein